MSMRNATHARDVLIERFGQKLPEWERVDYRLCRVTPEIADRLARDTGTTPGFWWQVQSSWDDRMSGW